MTYKLFGDFQQHKKAHWKEQVIKDLKGKDFDETLLWRIDENVLVDAYYDQEDTLNIRIKSIQQAQNQRVNASWQYRETIKFTNEKDCNSLIISGLLAGVNEITIDFDGVRDWQVEVKELLRNIKLSDTPFFLKVENNCLGLVNSLQQIAPYQWKGGINYDGLAIWMCKGIWDENYWNGLGQILRKVQNYPHFRTVILNSHHFHNFGANVGQELAYTLASAIETIDRLSEQGFSLLEIVQKIEFSVSVGTTYFVEIAKIRALKMLWFQILRTGYGMSEKEIPVPSVHCETSSFYSASITPHTNMLRATTEAMSAVIGGCDALTIKAFDESFKESDEFGKRIAKNISIILKEESYFDKVIDPSAGSYFIENLTAKISGEALKLLQQIESQGGIMEAFKSNFIQNEINRNFEAEENNLISGKNTMVGVNKFRFDEVPFVKLQTSENEDFKQDFELLIDRRISQKFEQ
ncbi:MAG: methylmalonyl-CoA mutase family protein [Arcicella sp.]|nr:methylmalonyl-CoA mutase family protein [Arcicella sp.]